MSLATERSRRNNAGARMTKLLDNEEEDEFYKSTYGGFDEEADDNDYESEGSDDDQVDSDFDNDEQDEVKSDQEDADLPKRKKRGISTKAYKEPAKKAKSDKDAKPKTKVKKPKKIIDRAAVQIYQSEKKSLRQTTSEKRKEAERRQKEEAERKNMLKDIAKKKNVAEVRRLTQEELLEEAKITEGINLRSLETYHRMELERKKTRITKRGYTGPMIRYHSMTMPLIEELPRESPEINVDGENGSNGESGEVKKGTKTTDKCSRTFITFTDETTVKRIFPQKKCKPPVRKICPVTRMYAKYYDPLTETPYATLQGFKLIREAYKREVETPPTEKRRSIQQS